MPSLPCSRVRLPQGQHFPNASVGQLPKALVTPSFGKICCVPKMLSALQSAVIWSGAKFVPGIDFSSGGSSGALRSTHKYCRLLRMHLRNGNTPNVMYRMHSYVPPRFSDKCLPIIGQSFSPLLPWCVRLSKQYRQHILRPCCCLFQMTVPFVCAWNQSNLPECQDQDASTNTQSFFLYHRSPTSNTAIPVIPLWMN